MKSLYTFACLKSRIIFYKIRVSRDEYNKKRNNLTKTQLIGGVKSEEEIINQLRISKAYDRWDESGKYFGLTSRQGPYRFFDADNNIVDVSSISKTYKPGSVPVFKQVIDKSRSFVNDRNNYTHQILDSLR